MARRSGMMTALQAALAGFSGGIEGRMQQRAADEEKGRLKAALERQKEQDAFAKASFLQQAGYRIAPEAYDTEDPEARRGLMPLAAPAPVAPPEARASGALSTALKRGIGVDETQPTMARPTFSQAPLALDTGVTRMTDVFERAKGMRPAQEQAAASVDLPGVGPMRFLRPESAAQISARKLEEYTAQEGARQRITAEQKKAEKETKNEEITSLADLYQSSYVDANGRPLGKDKALSSARAGKTPIEMGFAERPMTAAEKQRYALDQRSLGIQEETLNLRKKESGEETGQGQIANGLQAMGKARAATALNLLETNTQIMKQFEKDLSEGKVKMTGVQLEAARKALSGSTGSAMAEEALNKGNFLIDKNPALIRYVRAGKSIASAVREITPRGGSNMMMQMENALSGIGPGGTDPESLAQVDAFRNDLLEGVRAGVDAMTGKRSEAPRAVGGGARGGMSPDEWLDANPQRSNESDAAYKARYKAATGGR